MVSHIHHLCIFDPLRVLHLLLLLLLIPLTPYLQESHISTSQTSNAIGFYQAINLSDSDIRYFPYHGFVRLDRWNDRKESLRSILLEYNYREDSYSSSEKNQLAINNPTLLIASEQFLSLGYGYRLFHLMRSKSDLMVNHFLKIAYEQRNEEPITTANYARTEYEGRLSYNIEFRYDFTLSDYLKLSISLPVDIISISGERTRRENPSISIDDQLTPLTWKADVLDNFPYTRIRLGILMAL